MNSRQTEDADKIAVIGMAGRFPGAESLQAFWENLRDGVESISFFSDEELEAEGVPTAFLNDPHLVKAGGVLEGVEQFDAAFFDYSPQEAEIMDPQQRLFLECAWGALEDAGYNSEEYPGRIGVYAGAGLSSYLLFNLHPNLDVMEAVLSGAREVEIGNGSDYLATLASFKLKLRGPSVTVQTASSTSLVAVCLACQSLLNYQCDMALAGGVLIRIPQRTGYFYREGGILSPDGHCRAFDARARGTVGGSGTGVVLLKRLEDALADRDHIYAVIRGWAVYNDGASAASYEAPSVDGQAEAIAEALALAGIGPETLGYVEAHGSGTPLGDAMEIAALTKVFRTQTQRKGFCAIGSVKPNIGYLSHASGVAGLIKTCLALENKLIPPTIHFDQPNPEIDFENSPFYVNTELREWRPDGAPRRAGVSSFGAGGTCAHIVLEESPVSTSESSSLGHLLVWSAKSESALEEMTTNLVRHLQQYPGLDLADVAYTLQAGRKTFDHRRALVCHGLEDALEALEVLDPDRVFTRFQERRDRPVVFVFPGQDTPPASLSSELYQSEPAFRKAVDLCSELLEDHLGLDLREELCPEAGVGGLKGQLSPALGEPALFVIEYALAKLWEGWGVQPEAMIGWGVGEHVAASLARVLSLQDALTVVAARGRLVETGHSGSRAAVPLPGEEMQDLAAPFLGLSAECVILEPPRIPFVSSVSGTWILDEEATNPSYWIHHLGQVDRHAEGLREVLSDPDPVLLELGSGQALKALKEEERGGAADRLVASFNGPAADSFPEAFSLLDALGRLWLAGCPVDWSRVVDGKPYRRVPLPTYPFERQRYWIEPPVRVTGGVA